MWYNMYELLNDEDFPQPQPVPSCAICLPYEQLLLGYRRSVVLLLGMRIVGRILVHKKDYSANQWLDAVGLTAHLAAFSVFDGDQSTKWIQTESALDE